MKKTGILNPQLLAAIAETGHGLGIVIADAGLPLSGEGRVIDLSVSRGVPSFLQVLEAVAGEFVAESFVTAQEMEGASPDIYKGTAAIMGGAEHRRVSHSEFKKMAESARWIVRTGETTPYANAILIGGVNF